MLDLSINMWSFSRRWHGWNEVLSLSMWQFHLYYLLNGFDEAFFGRIKVFTLLDIFMLEYDWKPFFSWNVQPCEKD